MIALMSKNISSFFISHGIISAEDWEVCEYIFEILFSTAFSFLFLAVTSLVSGTVVSTILFLIGFIPLRLAAGGYHAKSHLRCFVVLVFVYPVYLLALHFIPAEYMIYAIIPSVLVSALLVFLIAPSEDKNKPIAKTDIPRLKQISRIVAVVYAVLIGTLIILLSDMRIAFSIATGVLAVGLTLLASYIKFRAVKSALW